MTLQNYVKLLRTRWVLICVTIAVGVSAAVALNLLTTPLYEASTTLFVSTTTSGSPGEIYQGDQFSQDRVKSYTELITGET